MLPDQLQLRDAAASDLPDLVALRSDEAHHRGRLRDANAGGFRYFIIQRRTQPVGFVCLVFKRPISWANTADQTHLPEISDLFVVKHQRGLGCGSYAIHNLERIVIQSGGDRLYIAVEPAANPRAFALYRRLGYAPLQTEPFYHRWAAVDGDGITQQGDAWLVNMVRTLAVPTQ